MTEIETLNQFKKYIQGIIDKNMEYTKKELERDNGAYFLVGVHGENINNCRICIELLNWYIRCLETGEWDD